MKHFSLLSTVVLCLLWACTNNTNPGESSISVSDDKTSVSITEDNGSTNSIEITTTSDWTLTTSDTKAVPTWFEVSPTHGGAGTHTLTIKVKEDNYGDSERIGYIKILCGSKVLHITVSQAAIKTKLVSKITFPGGSYSFEYNEANKPKSVFCQVSPSPFEIKYEYSKDGGIRINDFFISNDQVSHENNITTITNLYGVTYQFHFKDGNIVKISELGGADDDSLIINYSEHKNKQNIDIISFCLGGNTFPFALLAIQHFGLSSKNLPSSYNPGGEIINISYNLDNNGYIERVKIAEDSATISYK